MKFVAYLTEAGYGPFNGAVDKRVYAFFECPHPAKAKWYIKKSPQSFQCAGCKEQCETDDPTGFQVSLLDM